MQASFLAALLPSWEHQTPAVAKYFSTSWSRHQVAVAATENGRVLGCVAAITDTGRDRGLREIHEYRRVKCACRCHLCESQQMIDNLVLVRLF